MKKNIEIDLLRVFAIIAVIAILLSAAFVRSQQNSLLTRLNSLVDTFAQFAIPLFILGSGVVLAVIPF